MSNCEKCIHANVCKNKDVVERYEDKILDMEAPDFIELKVKCKDFVEDKPTTKEVSHPYIPGEPIELPKVISWDKTWPDNTCEKCTWYQEHKDDPITIGDTPCGWCWKRQVTCGNTTIRLTDASGTTTTLSEMPKPSYDQGIQCINSEKTVK